MVVGGAAVVVAEVLSPLAAVLVVRGLSHSSGTLPQTRVTCPQVSSTWVVSPSENLGNERESGRLVGIMEKEEDMMSELME